MADGLRGLYTIPADVPFARALALALLAQAEGRPDALSRMHVLLPTRRACRTVRDAFLRQTEGQPLLLPRLSPLGDVDEDALDIGLLSAFDGAETLDLPPPLSPLRRQILLARAIMARPDFRQGPDHAMTLAAALGRLMDRIYTENLDISALPALAGEDFAAHWEITLDFLGILSRTWPEILSGLGVMDAAARRHALLGHLAALWTVNPPAGPVIAAGTTGSLPATAQLLKAIAALPQGAIVLPALDQALDEESWQALGDTHPQGTLKSLLKTLGAARTDVQPWPVAFNPAYTAVGTRADRVAESMTRGAINNPTGGAPAFMAAQGGAQDVAADEARAAMSAVRATDAASVDEDIGSRGAQGDVRAWLATELMRPAETSGLWAIPRGPAPAAIMQDLQSVVRLEADTQQDEARALAVIMREILETPGRTAALVTPDRRLARRVVMACRRWGITLDDSAGQPLSDAPVGTFLRLVAEAALQQARPVPLLALLRHGLCRAGYESAVLRRVVGGLETAVLRGPLPAPGFEGLHARLQARLAEKAKSAPVPAGGPDERAVLLTQLEALMRPLLSLCAEGGAAMEPQPFAAWFDAHLHVAEAMAATPHESGAARLWRHDDGEAASLFLTQVRAEAAALPPMTGGQYVEVLTALMRAVTVRPRYGTHPRLSILGQLEARMSDADVMILAGLNEGSWPPEAAHDPWMSRPMMARFGLPAPERGIGLAAHDFVQGFCARHVVLSRARRVEGAPTVPARWLQRLDTVLEGLGLSMADSVAAGRRYIEWARQLDRAAQVMPYSRPAPCPPVAVRPRTLSVTRVETWLADPYSIYARSILGLRKLEPLEKAPDAADRGTVLHAALERFSAVARTDIPADARAVMLTAGQDVLAQRYDEPGSWDFWWPRFERITDWFIDHERDWRQQATPFAVESTGHMVFEGPAGPFTLTARADRIDRLDSGAYALIDYKSGGTYSVKRIRTGDAPQLPLEGLILQHGGFSGLPARAVGYMGYWVLTGGAQPGDDKVHIDEDIETLLAETADGFAALIAAYDDENTPYYSLPDPDRAPRFNDYEQLARVQEWAALGDNGAEIAEDAA